MDLFYVPGSIATIKLQLRRTLVHIVQYSTYVRPITNTDYSLALSPSPRWFGGGNEIIREPRSAFSRFWPDDFIPFIKIDNALRRGYLIFLIISSNSSNSE